LGAEKGKFSTSVTQNITIVQPLTPFKWHRRLVSVTFNSTVPIKSPDRPAPISFG
jgi:hypothetical protein